MTVRGWFLPRALRSIVAEERVHTLGGVAVSMPVLAPDQLATIGEHLAGARDRILAERTMNRLLQGGCTAPMAGYAELQGDELWLRGLVGSLDGTQVIRAEARGARAQAEDIGREVAQALLERGAGPLLKA